MKKAFLIIMALLLSLSLPLSLASCGGDEVSEGGSQQTSAPEGSAPAESVPEGSVPEGSVPEDSVPDEDSAEASRPEGSETVKVENGLAVYMPADRPLRIAQFADVHFGIEGNAYHNNKVERTKKYLQYIVDTEKPDLIVCSGDTYAEQRSL